MERLLHDLWIFCSVCYTLCGVYDTSLDVEKILSSLPAVFTTEFLREGRMVLLHDLQRFLHDLQLYYTICDVHHTSCNVYHTIYDVFNTPYPSTLM